MWQNEQELCTFKNDHFAEIVLVEQLIQRPLIVTWNRQLSQADKVGL